MGVGCETGFNRNAAGGLKIVFSLDDETSWWGACCDWPFCWETGTGQERNSNGQTSNRGPTGDETKLLAWTKGVAELRGSAVATTPIWLGRGAGPSSACWAVGAAEAGMVSIAQFACVTKPATPKGSATTPVIPTPENVILEWVIPVQFHPVDPSENLIRVRNLATVSCKRGTATRFGSFCPLGGFWMGKFHYFKILTSWWTQDVKTNSFFLGVNLIWH